MSRYCSQLCSFYFVILKTRRFDSATNSSWLRGLYIKVDTTWHSHIFDNIYYIFVNSTRDVTGDFKSSIAGIGVPWYLYINSTPVTTDAINHEIKNWYGINFELDEARKTLTQHCYLRLLGYVFRGQFLHIVKAWLYLCSLTINVIMFSVFSVTPFFLNLYSEDGFHFNKFYYFISLVYVFCLMWRNFIRFWW